MSSSNLRTLAFGLVVALAVTGCKGSGSVSTDIDASGHTQYYGNPHPQRAALGDWIPGVGWRNQTGHLGDGTPPRPAPVPAPAPAPAPAPKPEPPRADMCRASLAFPTGDRATSAVLLEIMAPSEVRANAPYVTELRVTNLTQNVLDGVHVTDQTTGDWRMTGSDPAGSGKGWALGRLNPAETKVIKVTGVATGAGHVGYCASVTYNSVVCCTTRVVDPKLAITKSAPAEVLTCDDIPVKFVVSNTGSGTIRNVVVADDLPAGMTTKDGQSKISVPVGALEPNQSREVTVICKANQRGTFTNTAKAAGDGAEATSNSTTTVARQPVLALTKTGPQRGFMGTNATFELTVSNTGDGEARNTMVEDIIPAGATFVSATEGGAVQGNAVVWNLGTLAPGATRKMSLTVRTGGAGQLKNTARAKAYCAADANAEAMVMLEGIPAVLLEVVDEPDPVQLGQETTYIIVVTNQGSADGTNIRIACMFEPEMQFMAGSGITPVAGAAAAGATSITFEPLARLAPKARAEWRVRVKALKEGDVRFKVTMNADQIGRNVEETEATRFYQ
jgi:uncharacterized repeat protein (TIGR01451 family)